MTVDQSDAALLRVRAEHDIQRAHELGEALSAARHLQARLEMLGDHDLDVRWTLSLRDRLASGLQRLVEPVAGVETIVDAHGIHETIV